MPGKCLQKIGSAWFDYKKQQVISNIEKLFQHNLWSKEALMNLSKYKKWNSVITQCDCKTTNIKKTESSCLFTCSGKIQKEGEH